MGLELRGQAGLLELLEEADQVVGVQLEGSPWRKEGGGDRVKLASRSEFRDVQLSFEPGTFV